MKMTSQESTTHVESIKLASEDVQLVNAALQAQCNLLTRQIEKRDAQHKAFRDIAIAHGMSGDIKVIKGDVTNFVIGDAA